jgi:hypothetical protein
MDCIESPTEDISSSDFSIDSEDSATDEMSRYERKLLKSKLSLNPMNFPTKPVKVNLGNVKIKMDGNKPMGGYHKRKNKTHLKQKKKIKNLTTNEKLNLGRLTQERRENANFQMSLLGNPYDEMDLETLKRITLFHYYQKIKKKIPIMDASIRQLRQQVPLPKLLLVQFINGYQNLKQEHFCWRSKEENMPSVTLP